jgi:hypothetical protein
MTKTNCNTIVPALAVAASGLLAQSVLGAAVSFSSTGNNAANLAPGVDAFRTAVGGPVNAPATGPFTTGRREINWDANALDAFASPNLMPNTFFNNNSRRGAVFTTPGDGFLLSQRAAQNGPASVRFGDIDPSYAGEFQAFSPERLFAAKNSTVTDVLFFVPSSPATPATVSAFGAVFTDVDSDSSTFMQFFDVGGNLLHTAFASPSDKGLTFVGATFNGGERIARVRITSGNTAMGAGVIDGGSNDIVVMDDFIYAEPIEVPAPGAGLVLGLAGVAASRRKR